jgi:aminoglycoside phosphotransferase (APT) family kinase protein
MLVATEAWAAQHGSAEDRAQHAGIEAARPRVTAWSERLAASPVPPSIDHDDLHARNVLVKSRDDLDSARFYDWGDSVVAHPFTSLLIALRSMQDRLRVGPDDVALIRMRDAYLEVFDGSGSRADLVETVEIACHTGKIARAVVWNRALGAMAPDEAGDFAGAPLYWLSQVLERSPLGDLDS